MDDFTRSRPAWTASPLLGLAELRRRQGNGEEAARLLDGVGPSRGAQVGRARLSLDHGDSLGAVELLDRVLRQVPPSRKLDRFSAVELLVRARVERGELEQAGAGLEELRELERLVGTAPMRAFVELAEGMIVAAAGDREDRARPLLEDAVDGFERDGAPFESARARIELRRRLLALGRTQDSEREARAAFETLADLGAKSEAGRARRLLGATEGRQTDELPVTKREREVLRLLAEGLTNRQIAERLVVSEHTVHRHVTNILRKLDLPSRTAAAARAVQAGLLDT